MEGQKLTVSVCVCLCVGLHIGVADDHVCLPVVCVYI